jgi:hypothetical protein
MEYSNLNTGDAYCTTSMNDSICACVCRWYRRGSQLINQLIKQTTLHATIA